MILQLSPQELLSLYKSLLLSNDTIPPHDLIEKVEDILLSSLEESWQKSLVTGFDKWVKSETNRIEKLEDELKKINNTIPRDELRKKFVPSSDSNSRKKGRPRKSK